MATNTTRQTPKKSNNMTPQGTYNKEKRELLVSSAKNLQAFNGWVGGRSGSKNGNKKTENYNTSCDLDPPHTLAPRLPDVCEKNVFRFIRSSASGKQHFSHTTGSHAKPNHATVKSKARGEYAEEKLQTNTKDTP